MPRFLHVLFLPARMKRASWATVLVLMAAVAMAIVAQPLLGQGPGKMGGGASPLPGQTPAPGTSDDPELPPGCSISYGFSPNAMSPGPNWPCSMSCESSEAQIREYLGESTQRYQCGLQGPSTWTGFDYAPMRKDPKDRFFPAGRGPAGSVGCKIRSGAEFPYLPVYTTVYPEGHPKCAEMEGDPHLKTFDGLLYDLQGAGEFIAVQSLDDELEVQARLKPLFSVDYASFVTAIAARVGSHRVMIESDSDTPLRIDGNPVELADGYMQPIEEGRSTVIRAKNRYSVVWPDGTNLHVDLFSPILNLYLLPAEARDGRLQGVLGDGDGDEGKNDFRTRDGRGFEFPLDFGDLYKVFAESWRIAAGESLFTYASGENTETFVDRNHPSREATVDDLEPAVRERAEEQCRAAGVVEPEALHVCIYDFGFSGDEVYIQSALSLQKPPEWEPLTSTPAPSAPAIEIDAPAEDVAAHNREIRLEGPVEAGYWLRFAPANSIASAQAANPYSSTVLNEGGAQTVELVVPAAPGDYELRYGVNSSLGEATVVQSQPFRSTAPNVTLEAPASVEVGGEIEVRVSGDIGGFMTLIVAPVGSPPATPGPNLGLSQGTEAGGVIQSFDTPPGEYEIRCISGGGVGVQVYARRALTIR